MRHTNTKFPCPVPLYNIIFNSSASIFEFFIYISALLQTFPKSSEIYVDEIKYPICKLKLVLAKL
jgi:hypothetical protein